MGYAIPDEELMLSGHLACPGCGGSLSMRLALKALGEETIVVIPACCWSIIAGPFPYSSLKVPLMHTAFETGGSVAAGIKAGLEVQGDTETTVLTWAGDGGTFDIGLQALSAAVERNEDFIYACYDNEAYMNTGIQRSSATPWGAWTTTTPVRQPKDTPKKDIVAIMAAHKIPYIATASVAYPEDMVRKAKRAKETRGTKFMHVWAPCPTGWKSRPEDTVKLARMAVQSGIFPLFEIENGETYKMSIKISEKKPITDYLRLQGRFRHLKDDDIKVMQEEVDRKWSALLERVERVKS